MKKSNMSSSISVKLEKEKGFGFLPMNTFFREHENRLLQTKIYHAKQKLRFASHY